VRQTLKLAPDQSIAKRYARYTDFLFLGRSRFSDRTRGALKLKEISYIHARATRGRDETRPHCADQREVPSVFFVPRRDLHKIVSSMQEIKARKEKSSRSSPKAALCSRSRDEVIPIPTATRRPAISDDPGPAPELLYRRR